MMTNALNLNFTISKLRKGLGLAWDGNDSWGYFCGLWFFPTWRVQISICKGLFTLAILYTIFEAIFVIVKNDKG